MASKETAVKHALSLSVQYAVADDALATPLVTPLVTQLPRQRIRRWVQATLASPAQVTIRFVDAEEGQALNRDYRDKDYATNVLSFVYEQEPAVMGDLVICLPVIVREAAEQGKPLEAHFAHMIVHGMLHLQGYDHETSAEDAEIMESQERAILARLGFADPYINER